MVLFVLGGMWNVRIAAVNLVFFDENGSIFKTSQGIIWAEVFLVGTSVVGSYTGKRQTEGRGRPKAYLAS